MYFLSMIASLASVSAMQSLWIYCNTCLILRLKLGISPRNVSGPESQPPTTKCSELFDFITGVSTMEKHLCKSTCKMKKKMMFGCECVCKINPTPSPTRCHWLRGETWAIFIWIFLFSIFLLIFLGNFYLDFSFTISYSLFLCKFHLYFSF